MPKTANQACKARPQARNFEARGRLAGQHQKSHGKEKISGGLAEVRAVARALSFGILAIAAFAFSASCHTNSEHKSILSKPPAAVPSAAFEHPSSPSGPYSLVATVNSSDWITLTWKSVGKDVYYSVNEGLTADFDPDYFSDVGPPGSRSTSFDDGRAEAGMTYFFKVYAIRALPTTQIISVGEVSATTPK